MICLLSNCFREMELGAGSVALLVEYSPSVHTALVPLHHSITGHMPAIPALGKWRQKHQKSRVTLSNIESLRPAWNKEGSRGG